MSIRAIAYSYGDLKNLQAHKEEVLERVWKDLTELEEQRTKRFRDLLCHSCREPLNVVRAFEDGIQYVDKCKKCESLNVFKFEDIFWLDQFDFTGEDKVVILRTIWKFLVIIVDTRLPEFCPKCGKKLDWVCLYAELHQFGALCKCCGSGYSQVSF